MKENKKNIPLNFENDSSESNSIDRIRSDFFMKILARSFVLISLVIFLLFGFYFFPILLPRIGAAAPEEARYIFNLFTDFDITSLSILLSFTIFWCIVIFLAYILFIILKRVFYKHTNILVLYLEQEVANLGFKIKKKDKSINLFIYINLTFYIIILIFNIYLSSIFGSELFLIFLFLLIFITFGVIFPVAWGSYRDKIYIKIKKRKYIRLDFKYSSSKKNRKYKKLYIYLKTNRLCLKINKLGSDLLVNISKKRWLPRYGKSKLFSKLTLFHYFFEFSNPINFQNKLLNIMLALREWNKKYTQSITSHRKK